MKKSIILSLVLIGSSNLLFASNKVYSTNLEYHYNYGNKKCLKTDFSAKREIMNMLNEGEAYKEDEFFTDAGDIIEITTSKNSYFSMMTSYGACRLFEDIVIKKMDAKKLDAKTYKDLKDPALKDKKK
ncbi:MULTISPECIES: hypothetical protein [Arcobacteraceae]|uniref:Uncharacterized protein n=1 Tax=Aliarcobacter thereius LMG 24486 TaxID=1032240 RepID=A0A1C7WPX7_9BACT|nr:MULTISPECIES: hypothetical protein [Arcobacteraceae]OCL82267.1 hypothetical protein AAW30_01552 [Arcobacter porcinus]OCL95820.1 hypothetical protein AA347_01302 [Aliarcobacter thereius LMG 24486]QBF16207.1 hypothetical protein ATH_1150 [Aliarcobacter thereius LMG 24486]TLS92168.1 hypothetical protein FE244_07135 [Aliarcobacter thereius]